MSLEILTVLLVTKHKCDHTYEALTVDGHDGFRAGVAVCAVDDGQLHELTLLQLVLAIGLLEQ